ncbi:D-alanyl-D-alanine carboxypeptidase-like protein [Nocardioides albertanoniae]|uniref:D-alanyl-D-alanine carboxypeptidase-like protein n=1 Tax=Nocardioides albertanoniae TaxID=1175486 RepID=A0A543AAV9_9ACTN|nr:M15 family metallopeptidase [Nocardioides albertanoniae]TQL69741.1 D-alanyl-D-alanine carboxypeptidase-like protein [Nocardioides albertanoniae]
MSDQQWPPRRPGDPRRQPRDNGQPRDPGRPGDNERPLPSQRPIRPERPGWEQQPRPGEQPYPGPQRPYQQPQQPYPSQQRPYPQDPRQQDPRQPYPGQPIPGRRLPGQSYPGQPYPGQSYPGQPHPGQHYPGQQPYPSDPRQPDPTEPYPGQPYGQDPWQPVPGQPIPGQPIPGQPAPAYPQGFGPGRFGPEPPKKRRWPKVLLVLLVLVLVGVAGYGGYDFYDQTQKWKQTATDDMRDLGSDLSVAVASMREVGWEVTAEDIGALLDQPAPHSDGLGLRTVTADEAQKSFTVAGYRTWQDTYAKRDHTTAVCAAITLGEGTKSPVEQTITDCPDSTPKSAPAATGTDTDIDTGGAEAEAGGVAGDLADLMTQAAERRSSAGASDDLLDVAAPTKPVGNMRADSTALRCAPGTNNIGEAEGYDEGKLIPVRLCAVEGMPNTGTESTKGDPSYLDGSDGLTVVNARISGAAAALVKKASKQGVDLVAGSSFRTMKKQKALCAEDLSGGCPAGDYTLTAQPGHSSHQLGIAIDFEEPSVTGGKTCATRASQPSSAVWRFLNKVALDFGLKQYAPEAWHWDAYGGKDRCAPL